MKQTLQLLSVLSVEELQQLKDTKQHDPHFICPANIVAFFKQLVADFQVIGRQYADDGDEPAQVAAKALFKLNQTSAFDSETFNNKLMLIADLLPSSVALSMQGYVITSLMLSAAIVTQLEVTQDGFQADLKQAVTSQSMSSLIKLLLRMDAYYPQDTRASALQSLHDFFADPNNSKVQEDAVAMIKAIEALIPQGKSGQAEFDEHWADLVTGIRLFKSVLPAATAENLNVPALPGLVNSAKNALEKYSPKIAPENVFRNMPVDDDEMAAIHRALDVLVSKAIIEKISEQQLNELRLILNEGIQNIFDDERNNYFIQNVKQWLMSHNQIDTPYNRSYIGYTLTRALAFKESGVRYDETHIYYGLYETVDYALRQYRDLNPSAYKGNRAADVEAIRSILANLKAGTSNPQAAINAINSFFNSSEFKPGPFGSRLKSIVLQAIQTYSQTNNGYSRTLRTKHWLPKEPQLSNQPRKVVLAIHGLGDNVHTFNQKAKAWTEAGYEVISYDQAGHGLDELRRPGAKINLEQMQLDFYAMVDKYQQDATVGEIVIAGHGFGGAIVAHALPTINDMRTQETTPVSSRQTPTERANDIEPKITKVELWAPTVKQSPTWSGFKSLSKLLSNTYDISSEEKNTRAEYEIENLGSNRILGRVNSVLAFMGESYRILRNIFTSRSSNNQVKPLDVEIHQGKQDPLANAKQAESLKRTVSLQSVVPQEDAALGHNQNTLFAAVKATVHLYPGKGHNLHHEQVDNTAAAILVHH